MTSGVVAYVLLVIVSTSWLETAVSQTMIRGDYFDVLKTIKKLTEEIENLEKKVETMQSTVKTQANLLNNSVEKEKLETLSRKSKAKAELRGTLLTNLNVKQEMKATLSNKLEAKIQMQATLFNELEDDIHEHLQAALPNKTQSNVTTIGAPMEELSNEFQKSVEPENSVEGIVAGTLSGVVIISLDSREQTIIPGKEATGVAFDFNARKVYWIEEKVGIKRANLDGTSVELLVEGSNLKGLALDPITGNFYYGKLSPAREIRVCSPSGKKCAVLVSGTDVVGREVFDIALHPTEGTMFWSDPIGKKTVIRASMDGKNVTVTSLENVYGLDLDEDSNRLYLVDKRDNSKSIVTFDLKTATQNVLLNDTLDSFDAAVNEDTVYFGDWDGKSVKSITEDGVISVIANTTSKVRHIALYGRNKVLSRPNPCEHSPCTNVCVLNPESFTCL